MVLVNDEIERLERVSLKIFDAIFSNQNKVELEGELYRIRKTGSGLRNVRYEGIFFVEQNPHKGSHWAKLANEGHKILWGLKGRSYVLRVMDGNFILLKKT